VQGMVAFLVHFQENVTAKFILSEKPLKIVIPPRAGHFSTLRLLASMRG
jgi:hypothetical protein